MTTHLSAPAGLSVNNFISKDSYSLQYASVDKAIAMLQRHGKGVLMAKTDVKQAFRLVPVHPIDWPLLGIRWKGQYYVDKCLSFGLSSAPFLFNCLDEAFEWILHHNYGVTDTLHYLDDFLTVGPPSSPACQAATQHHHRRSRPVLVAGVSANMAGRHTLPRGAWTPVPRLHLYTDAACTIGYGAYF